MNLFSDLYNSTHLVGKLVSHVRDVLLLSQDALAHLVDGRLNTSRVVGGESFKSSSFDRLEDLLKVDAERSESGGSERLGNNGDLVGAVDSGGENTVIDGCGAQGSAKVVRRSAAGPLTLQRRVLVNDKVLERASRALEDEQVLDTRLDGRSETLLALGGINGDVGETLVLAIAHERVLVGYSLDGDPGPLELDDVNVALVDVSLQD